MNLSKTDRLAAAALEVAVSQLGQTEQPKGSNCGPMVNQYLEAAGLNPGYAWCQAFMYWCYNEAARMLNLKCTAVKTASVAACWKKTADKYKLPKDLAKQQPRLIQPGMQLILSYGNNTGHTGIVERVDVIGAEVILHTIEGNSNMDGSREGHTVVRQKRRLNDKTLTGFISH